MSKVVIKAENISKQYRLGLVGTGTVKDDMKRWWYNLRGKEDPFLKIGEANDRSSKGESDYVWSLRDINFESNSVQLSDISFVELRRVIQLMRENPTLRVEVAAHTDDLGSENYNQVLSQQRAKSVADFLMENKIDPSRFEAKGYGESQAKVTNDNDVNRAINRRVELKILSI